MFNAARKLVKGRRDRNNYPDINQLHLASTRRLPTTSTHHWSPEVSLLKEGFITEENNFCKAWGVPSSVASRCAKLWPRWWWSRFDYMSVWVSSSDDVTAQRSIIIKVAPFSLPLPHIPLPLDFLIQKSNKPNVVWDRYTRGALEFDTRIINSSSPMCIQVAKGVWTFSRCAFPSRCSRSTDLANAFMSQALCSLWPHPVWRAFDRHQAERRRRMGVSLYTSRRGNEEYHR